MAVDVYSQIFFYTSIGRPFFSSAKAPLVFSSNLWISFLVIRFHRIYSYQYSLLGALYRVGYRKNISRKRAALFLFSLILASSVFSGRRLKYKSNGLVYRAAFHRRFLLLAPLRKSL
jgi:hypothetical protein